LITAEDGTKTFERILLPSDEMQKFVEGALAGLEVPEAKIKLGTGRVQFETLVKHALIKPLGGDRAASNFISVDRRFDPSDLDKFLERLISCVTTELTPDLVDIANAMRKTNCQFMEVITLLLDHSLKNVAFDTREVGIAGFRLDVEEVRRLALGEEHGCFAVSELQRLIPASSRIVKDLLKGGWLQTVQRKNPVKRNMQTVVEREALTKFKEEFVSLGNLATNRGTRTWCLKKQLDSEFIRPVFEAAGMPFYRQAELK